MSATATANVDAATDAGAGAASQPQQPLVMQLIIDRSLVSSSAALPPAPADAAPPQPAAPASAWGTGPLMAQAAHAAMAVTVRTLSSSRATQAYVAEGNLEGMHKVVLQYPGKAPKKVANTDRSASALLELSERLSEGRREWEQRTRQVEQQGEGHAEEEFPEHHLWIEQPENLPTCIAIAPNRKPPVSASASAGIPQGDPSLLARWPIC